MCRVRSVGERKKKDIALYRSKLLICTTLAADASLEYNGETQSNEHSKAPSALGVSQPVGFLIPKSLFSSFFSFFFFKSYPPRPIPRSVSSRQRPCAISLKYLKVLKGNKKKEKKNVVGNQATRSAWFSLAKNVCA